MRWLFSAFFRKCAGQEAGDSEGCADDEGAQHLHRGGEFDDSACFRQFSELADRFVDREAAEGRAEPDGPVMLNIHPPNLVFLNNSFESGIIM